MLETEQICQVKARYGAHIRTHINLVWSVAMGDPQDNKIQAEKSRLEDIGSRQASLTI